LDITEIQLSYWGKSGWIANLWNSSLFSFVSAVDIPFFIFQQKIHGLCGLASNNGDFRFYDDTSNSDASAVPWNGDSRSSARAFGDTV
jgi:hypothetical protein